MSPVKIDELVGQNVRRAREDRRWTQTQLGENLEPYLGRAWTRQAVSVAEKGGRPFSVGELLALAQIFALPIEWFLLPPAANVKIVSSEHRRGSLSARQLIDLLFDTGQDQLERRLQELPEKDRRQLAPGAADWPTDEEIEQARETLERLQQQAAQERAAEKIRRRIVKGLEKGAGQ